MTGTDRGQGWPLPAAQPGTKQTEQTEQVTTHLRRSVPRVTFTNNLPMEALSFNRSDITRAVATCRNKPADGSPSFQSVRYHPRSSKPADGSPSIQPVRYHPCSRIRPISPAQSNPSDITRGLQRGVGTIRLRWAGLDGEVGCCGDVAMDRVVLRGSNGQVWSGRVVTEWLRWAGL